MGSNSLQSSINTLQVALRFWNPLLGNNFEPALTGANEVQQRMTSPPFRFPWNRNTATFTCVAGTQDYTVTMTDFGYLEKATFQIPATTKWMPLSVLNVTPLGDSGDQQQMTTIAVQLNNVGISASFRLLGVPDKAYVVKLIYQKFAPLMVDPTSFWVAPDYMSYIYNRGLLAHLYEARGDARAPQERVAFAAALLSTAEGLTDTEVNIFLAQYLANPRALESLQLKTQQGVAARGT